MSDPASNFSFPHRTPVFTAVIVLAFFAAFGWLATRVYVPHAAEVNKVEGVRTPDDRRTILAEHRTKEQAESTTYGWVDQKAGIVRVPIERAIELTVAEHAQK
jgi:hypothetical protein